MEKSSLLLLQANTIVSPRASLSMDSFFLAIPELTELKLNTEGDVFVGILIGHLSFLVLSGGILDTYMQKVTHQLQESTR
jgi:hypothetical protein